MARCLWLIVFFYQLFIVFHFISLAHSTVHHRTLTDFLNVQVANREYTVLHTYTYTLQLKINNKQIYLLCEKKREEILDGGKTTQAIHSKIIVNNILNDFPTSTFTNSWIPNSFHFAHFAFSSAENCCFRNAYYLRSLFRVRKLFAQFKIDFVSSALQQQQQLLTPMKWTRVQ